jgi:pilus assembly protein CpaF
LVTDRGPGARRSLLDEVRRQLPVASGPAAVADLVRDNAPTYGTHSLLDAAEVVTAEVVGAGPLAPLLRLPGVTDVLVNGPGPVWVDRGAGLERSEVTITEDATLRRLAQRLVAAAGRRLDDALPYADARLADGTRVHAVLPPVSPQGTCLSLRLPPRRTFTLDDLAAAGSLPPAGADMLARLVAARLSFLVTGGTGTGKTTVLSTLLSLAAPAERLVLVEDASELRPAHPHVVRLEARGANAEGTGAVDLTVLVRQALRMRPDRLVVGEVRGAEVLELLMALNTGHEGGCGTVHANRPVHVTARIEALCALAGLPRTAAHSQLTAVDAVVHLRRGPDGRRRVTDLALLEADPVGIVHAVPAVRFADDGLHPGAAAGRLQDRLGALW